MGKALSLSKRNRIVKDWQSISNYAEVARMHKVSYQTVRRLCKRFEEQGQAGIHVSYSNCGPQGITSDALIYRASLWLKRLHPDWGAPFIIIKLKSRYQDRKIPNERTLQNWFRAVGLNRPKTKEPRQEKQWAKQVHDVWQIDGKEEQQLKDNSSVCWLTVVDEHSGSLIAAPAFLKKEFTTFLLEKFKPH